MANNSNGTAKSDQELQVLAREKLLYTAGTDNESRPVLICPLVNLPPLSSTDLDRLIPMMLDQTDTLVQDDYTIVLFAGGASTMPGAMWFVRAYQNLERKYKKNLKKLLIVHASYWVKLLLQVFAPIVSQKFAKKIYWCDDIASLATHLPISSLNIPIAIRELDARSLASASTASVPAVPIPSSTLNPASSTASTPGSPSTRVFGVPFEQVPVTGSGIPQVVEDCLFVVERNMDTEGVFRKSPVTAYVNAAKRVYDRGGRMVGEDRGGSSPSTQGEEEGSKFDVLVAGSLLKTFFRDMPEAVFREDHVEALIETATATQTLLRRVFSTLHQVSLRSSVNKMTSRNLGVVWQPNLFRTKDMARDLAVAGAAVEAVGSMVEEWVLF
ncbi:hypothetical protein HDU93_000150 [Gonapodya sp. JEL0774]|nr:hypothetical protein HDU93_000150 [Gonapodya sp. JEL0774]